MPRNLDVRLLVVSVMAAIGGCTLGPHAHTGARPEATSSGTNAGGINPAGSGQTGTNQTGTNQTGTNQTGTNPAGSNQAGTGSAGTHSIEDYAATIKANAERSDHESDPKVRAALADAAAGAAEACLALDSRAAACQYGKAVATGLEARLHPTRAPGLLSGMLENLGNAETADPRYDKGGPARVRALVLLRAPGWPLGPGDTDAGLEAARRAVTLQPDYPPNLLALAEALAKSGDPSGARANYAHARELALAAPAGLERDDWLHDADQGLKGK